MIPRYPIRYGRISSLRGAGVTAAGAAGAVEYEYEEQVIWWALPSPEYLERRGRRQVLTDAGRAYLASVEDEILGWAQAAGM